ncbi:MAG: PBSX family phage terminase large subunit [Huintestinicola sp.]
MIFPGEVISIRLNEKQMRVLNETIKAPKRWNISVGAMRSGKTYLDMYRIPYRLLHCDRDGGAAIVGFSEASIERNILEPMRKIYSDRLVGRIRSGGAVKLFGRQCVVIGGGRAGAADRMQGMSLSYCYGDEITTWNEEIFRMIQSRLDRKGAVFDGSCNPAEPSHWFKRFLDKGTADGSVYTAHFTIDDNGSLPGEFVEALKKEYRGTVYYDRYILGLWKNAEGAVYRQFADSPESFIIDRVDPKSIIMADIGVDFGGNGSATAFNLTGYTAGYEKVITLDEYYSRRIISPAKLEEDFIGFVRRVKKRYPGVRDIYCDSAEQVLIRGLENALIRERLPLEMHNARKGLISQRIRFYNSLMGRGRYFILKKCRHTIEAFEQAVWADCSEDRRLDDGSTNIDSLDAQEYSTEARMNEILTR